MLNGIDPIIIFNFKKQLPSVLSAFSKIPVEGDNPILIDLPLIPIYLSEKLTGIYIDSEDKSVNIDTQFQSTVDGSGTKVYQRPISSTVRISMVASRDSIGVALFSALADLVLPLVSTKECTITYLHGAVTVFNGLLHDFSITQNTTNDLYNITLELMKAPPGKLSVLEVGRNTGAIPL